MASKPSELAITIAALPSARQQWRGGAGGSEQGWLYADEVHHNVRRLGFEISRQQVVGLLCRMAAEDSPWIEIRDVAGGFKQYRVTRWGRTDVENNIPDLRLRSAWLGGSRV